ncbi:dynein axonemal assembly factor 3 isoform X3 [Alligator mississippiensis]|uniref:dynein axonemal assembly factor 3 isoform X3 n=1 Tax=Alligator mississippiensis TaxID=8496 RepID=UPI002877CFD7|nr:dynein axonemal assembly factor 3 isoform X3 [Alligator mississippiensis]
MTAAGTGTGFGTTTWWGFSPALDLQKECLEASLDHVCQSEEGLSELNILLVGSVDGRHVLKTMCQAHRWPQRKINFYIVENNPEVLARQLLFLSLALEPQEKMGLQEKSETFLELLGNSLMRSPTATYLQEKSDIFIRLATDPDFQQCYLPVLDMAGLKFKERDQLEGIFRFWLHPDPQAFPIVRLWDLRVRQYLGTRYDTRNGVSDWDLNMKLHEQGASVINIREYTRWRDTGVAFELREGIYDTPNKTLASGRLLRLNGDRVPARGYWGDIATGPYILFGIETEEQSLLKTINGVPSKSAQEISLHNVTAMFHELAARARYIPPGPDPKGDSVATPVPGDASQPQEQSQLVHAPPSCTARTSTSGSSTSSISPAASCPTSIRTRPTPSPPGPQPWLQGLASSPMVCQVGSIQRGCASSCRKGPEGRATPWRPASWGYRVGRETPPRIVNLLGS